MSEFIISLKPKYLDLMISGEKTIELRRRPIKRMGENSRVWVYGTLPVGAIKALGIVKSVLNLPAEAAWKKHKAQIAISEDEYFAYVESSEYVSLIIWEAITPLKEEYSLSDIRRKLPNFQPPQFYSEFTPPSRLANSLSRVSAPSAFP